MIDKVTDKLLNNYSEVAGINQLPISQQFERFVAQLILGHTYTENFSVDDCCLGDGVQGIDTAALAVNGAIVSDMDELEESIGRPGPIQADIVFIQSKTANKFSLGDISIFADTVHSVLTSDDQSSPIAGLGDFSDLLNRLFAESIRFTENPKVSMYYVTVGTWGAPPALTSKIEAARKRLNETNLFSSIYFDCWGASKIQESWRALDRGLEATILFENRTTLPDIPGIQEAHLGILPAHELMRLVSDDDGEIRRALFYDNVRDYQGDVDVNEDIGKTLQSSDRQRFAVLNNGITVVAKKLRTTGNKFTLSEYQIVNGCQTSHVIHKYRQFLDGVSIPFRVIVTDDEDVAKSITTATNKQTQVSLDNLLALLPHQKAIEQYFDAIGDEAQKRIYYERRSKQWTGSQQPRGAWRVITVRNLMRSFASIYQKSPQTAARYYSDLRARAESDVFNPEYHPAYFYSAAYAYCKMEHFFSSNALDRKLKPVRCHLLAGTRVWLSGNTRGDQIERSESKAESSLQPFNDLIWSDEQYLKVLTLVGRLIQAEAGQSPIDRDFGRTREQVDRLLSSVALTAGVL